VLRCGRAAGSAVDHILFAGRPSRQDSLAGSGATGDWARGCSRTQRARTRAGRGSRRRSCPTSTTATCLIHHTRCTVLPRAVEEVLYGDEDPLQPTVTARSVPARSVPTRSAWPRLQRWIAPTTRSPPPLITVARCATAGSLRASSYYAASDLSPRCTRVTAPLSPSSVHSTLLGLRA